MLLPKVYVFRNISKMWHGFLITKLGCRAAAPHRKLGSLPALSYQLPSVAICFGFDVGFSHEAFTFLDFLIYYTVKFCEKYSEKKPQQFPEQFSI